MENIILWILNPDDFCKTLFITPFEETITIYFLLFIRQHKYVHIIGTGALSFTRSE